MIKTPAFLLFVALFITITISESKVEASLTGPLIKQLLTFLKWMRGSPKTPQVDGDLLQFETGYLVETVVEGNRLGIVPHSIRVSPEGELFAVDSVNSNVVKISPPVSQYSRARLVAGSFQGYSGLVDGKPSDARFNHPKGFAIDDRGNVYVADILNMAIRKIGEAGVTTIAGGKSTIGGYMDGPSEDAKFSSDFDLIYMGSTCSLLVVDRGNAALRQIALNREDCDHQFTSVSASDEWWRNFGIDDLELQTLAIRILSQTCSSSGCERNWSVFERIHTKRRNRLEHKRLNDLVYTHYNLRLKERQASRKSLTDPISLENIDLTDDWVVEAEDDDAPLLDVDEIDDWMDVADAILDEGEGGAAADIILVAGALLVGYASCLLQHGLGPSFFSRTKQAYDSEFQFEPSGERPTSIEESLKENPDAGWPSPWKLISDVFKFIAETLSSVFFNFLPFKSWRSKKGLTSLRDSLVMPEDTKEPPLSQTQRSAWSVSETLLQKQRSSWPVLESLQASNASNNYSQDRPQKSKPALVKDPSLTNKHRSSKRQDFKDFNGSSEPSQYKDHSSKSQKDRTRHRHHDKNREVVFGAVGSEPKPVEIKSADYADPKFDQYNARNKYGMDNLFQF